MPDLFLLHEQVCKKHGYENGSDTYETIDYFVICDLSHTVLIYQYVLIESPFIIRDTQGKGNIIMNSQAGFFRIYKNMMKISSPTKPTQSYKILNSVFSIQYYFKSTINYLYLEVIDLSIHSCTWDSLQYFILQIQLPY